MGSKNVEPKPCTDHEALIKHLLKLNRHEDKVAHCPVCDVKITVPGVPEYSARSKPEAKSDPDYEEYLAKEQAELREVFGDQPTKSDIREQLIDIYKQYEIPRCIWQNTTFSDQIEALVAETEKKATVQGYIYGITDLEAELEVNGTKKLQEFIRRVRATASKRLAELEATDKGAAKYDS